MPDDRALRVALDAAMRAGEHARKAFGKKHRITVKPDRSPVTAIDRTCEEIIRRIVSRAFPNDGFLGEEFGTTRTNAEARWILDPLDGTKSYIRGLPFWGTLLAREVRGRLTVGVMYMPVMDKLLWASRGGGAFLGKRRIRVSRHRRLRGAMILHGDFDAFVRHRAVRRQVAIARRGAIIRSLSDCQAYLWVASGAADAMIEPIVSPWDVAAPKIILEEAGGRFTNWQGKNSHMVTNVLATNGPLHAPLLALLKRKK